ncbi:hypothetical protein PENTCL1PPCAC_28978, partial [Pristionchus entomophagus]
TGIIVVKDAGVKKLGITVVCNEGAANPFWKVDIRFDININNDFVQYRDTANFHQTFTRARLALPEPLADVLKVDSPYLNADGNMPIKITVVLGSVVGYERPFTYTIRMPHKHLADTTLNVEGTLIYVHSAVLGLRSRVFYDALFGPDGADNRLMMVIDNCSLADFTPFLEMIYTDDRSLTDTTVIPVLRLAKRFVMPGLVLKCIDFFRPNNGDRQMTLECLLSALQAADELKIGEMFDVCVKEISTNNLYDVVQESEVYQNLSPQSQ